MRCDGWTIRPCDDPSSLLDAVDVDPRRYRDLASLDPEVAALRFEQHVVGKPREAFPGMAMQPRVGSARDGFEVRPPPATPPEGQRPTEALMIGTLERTLPSLW